MTSRTVLPDSARPEITGVPDAEVPGDVTTGRACGVVSTVSRPVTAEEMSPAGLVAVAESS